MSVQGTYNSHIDLTVDYEPITFAVMVVYDYTPGEYNRDPQLCVSGELIIESLKVEFADGLWAEVDPEYKDGIVDKLNPEFQTFLDKAWQQHLDDVDRDRAEERYLDAAGF